jgi:hypothetical protein
MTNAGVKNSNAPTGPQFRPVRRQYKTAATMKVPINHAAATPAATWKSRLSVLKSATNCAPIKKKGVNQNGTKSFQCRSKLSTGIISIYQTPGSSGKTHSPANLNRSRSLLF